MIICEIKGGMFKMASKMYPEYPWDWKEWRDKVGRKAQNILCKTIGILFGMDVSLETDHLSPIVKYLDTNKRLQLDIWIPRYNIAFEYQGRQHYLPDNHFIRTFEEQVERDQRKKIACMDASIQLIGIPYWWDFDSNALFGTIMKV
jgi:hypothetical protein